MRCAADSEGRLIIVVHHGDYLKEPELHQVFGVAIPEIPLLCGFVPPPSAGCIKESKLRHVKALRCRACRKEIRENKPFWAFDYTKLTYHEGVFEIDHGASLLAYHHECVDGHDIFRKPRRMLMEAVKWAHELDGPPRPPSNTNGTYL